ncbi:MAG: penicillin-binding protein 1C [Chitinophagales bacterium]|nr:penicillin-binding protein 1C [Chitinophagales bacterium]
MIFIIAGLIVLWLFMPIPDYKPAFSKQLYARDNRVLSANVSSEQQWCFPLDEALPEALKASIILYEDEYFYWHPGVNPISAVKAAIQNYKAGRIVRGASTIPMQIMRIKNRHSQRTLLNKIWETISALKYRMFYNSSHILKEWCEIAPFGGNVIGVKAAALKYFHRPMDKLSWAEYALLAVMPNAPTFANLKRNRAELKRKRDFLLRKLHDKGYFDASELGLYLGEELPTFTGEIPQYGYHLLKYLSKEYSDQSVYYTTVDYDIQLRTQELLERESSFLQADDINNLAAVILDVESNQLIAYHGNVRSKSGKFSYVDVAQAPRSYGSLLKPILFAHVLDIGELLPQEMIADIPTVIGDFQPENFDKKFRGAVSFSDMLIQSLNVPAVRVLNTTGLQSFYDRISRLQVAYLNKGADHYGLSIILGGGESSLWDLTRLYKGMARNYAGYSTPFDKVKILKDEVHHKTLSEVTFSAFSIHHTVNTMADLTRPREEKSWDLYGTDYKVAWKTGTSYGHRDSWAIGFNGKYAVGVWVGNETGEGRFGLTGISKAAPVMFKLFNVLPDNHWFGRPPAYSDHEIIRICSHSGKIAGPLCNQTKVMDVSKMSYRYVPCTWHKVVGLDAQGLALSEDCLSNAVKLDTFFTLPPYMEYYYKQAHINYRIIPAFSPACSRGEQPLKIIYPNQGVKVFLPKESVSKQQDIVMKAYHRDDKAVLYWFVNDQYIGTTNNGHHEMLFKSKKGHYQLYITDQNGHNESVKFDII